MATCPGGEIGRRRGLKIPRRKVCRFESDPGHHKKPLISGYFFSCRKLILETNILINRDFFVFVMFLIFGDLCKNPSFDIRNPNTGFRLFLPLIAPDFTQIPP